jgi:hypothetical protein
MCFRVFLGERTAVSVAFPSACDCAITLARYLAMTAFERGEGSTLAEARRRHLEFR